MSWFSRLRWRLAARLRRRAGQSPRVAGPARLPTRGDEPLRLAALEAAANAMFIADRSGRIVWVNAAFTRMTGYGPDEALGRTPRLLRSGRQPRALYEQLWRTILAGEVWRGRLVNRRKNGEVYDVEQTISPIRGAGGQVSHFLAVHEDIFERLQRERRLGQEALVDPATGLASWNLLRRRLLDAVARAKRSGRYLAVLSLAVRADGDGNGALQARVAPLVAQSVRQPDLVARHGDALVVVIESLEQPELAANTALRLLALLRKPLPGDPPLAVRAQVGITVYPGDDESPEILLQHATQARHGAAGRSEFRFFDYSV